MTSADKLCVDTNLKNFNSFIEFHKFLFSRGIEFTHDEWVEYRDKFLAILNLKNSKKTEERIIPVDTCGLILP